VGGGRAARAWRRDGPRAAGASAALCRPRLARLRRSARAHNLTAALPQAIFDFDLCLLSVHSFGLRLEPRDVLARPLARDFCDVTFFCELVEALAARGIRVAIASFGRYDVIQAYMDRVFCGNAAGDAAGGVAGGAAGGEAGACSCAGHGAGAHLGCARLRALFTRDTISTPSTVGGQDGCEVPAGKNRQLEALAAALGVDARRLLFFDDSAPNIAKALEGGRFPLAVHCEKGFTSAMWARGVAAATAAAAREGAAGT
jgi:hypothetical protein